MYSCTYQREGWGGGRGASPAAKHHKTGLPLPFVLSCLIQNASVDPRHRTEANTVTTRFPALDETNERLARPIFVNKPLRILPNVQLSFADW